MVIYYRHEHKQYRERALLLEEQSRELLAAREEAEQAKNDAIDANMAKTRFLANMSHEIRTPINSIIGMDEMIIRECHEGHIREYATSIRQASQSLLFIINDILDITRIESQKMELVPVEYKLGELIQGLMEMLSLRASSKNLELKTNIAANLPSVLYGDEVRIRQILTNLITNAIKYTHEGSVTLIVNGRTESDSIHLHFAVKDTGIGIKPEDIEKLGLAFERVDMARNRNIEGSGLGLSITKQLLHLMDSSLKVDSEYGKGSVFSFDLTQKIVNTTPMKLEKTVMKETSDSSISFIAPNAKILVVDDNAMNRKVFTGLLKKTKIQITEAESGKQCLELVKNSHYDLIFLDHMMPEMSGVEVFQEMQKWDEYPCKDTPKVMLTANALAEAKEEYNRLGFDGFLAKPIIIKDLESMIQHLLPDELVVVPDAPSDASVPKDIDADPERIDNLPVIEGVFWDVAKRYFTSASLLMNAVSDFYNSIDGYCQLMEMLRLYAQTGEDVSSYGERVDAIRSSASAIGAMPLAGICDSLSRVLTTKQNEHVLAIIPPILDRLHSLKEQLGIAINYYKKQI
jgi:CheY-like chemotaxis protein